MVWPEVGRRELKRNEEKVNERKIIEKIDDFLLIDVAKKIKRNQTKNSFSLFGFIKKKKENIKISALKICVQKLISFQFNVKIYLQILSNQWNYPSNSFRIC